MSQENDVVAPWLEMLTSIKMVDVLDGYSALDYLHTQARMCVVPESWRT